jgi:ABC-type glutathione transport system ATPase component
VPNAAVETDAEGNAKSLASSTAQPVATRFVAWLFDDVHAAPPDLMRARLAADRHFTESLEPGASHIRVENLTISYENPKGAVTFIAVSSVNLDIARGTFVTIVGPSGCGKSSLLLAIATFTPNDGADYETAKAQVRITVKAKWNSRLGEGDALDHGRRRRLTLRQAVFLWQVLAAVARAWVLEVPNVSTNARVVTLLATVHNRDSGSVNKKRTMRLSPNSTSAFKLCNGWRRRADLAAALNRLSIPGRYATLIYSAVRDSSENIMKKQQSRKVLILLTDGIAFLDPVSIGTAIEFAQRADTILYSIRFSEKIAA